MQLVSPDSITLLAVPEMAIPQVPSNLKHRIAQLFVALCVITAAQQQMSLMGTFILFKYMQIASPAGTLQTAEQSAVHGWMAN